MAQLVIYLWTLPTTVVGLLFLPLVIFRGRANVVDGVLELHSPVIAIFLSRCVPLPAGASAMTLGHVVIARNQFCLDQTRAHERVHVRQAQRWGPFFIPAYLLIGLLLKLRGRDAYHDHPFEREAFAISN